MGTAGWRWGLDSDGLRSGASAEHAYSDASQRRAENERLDSPRTQFATHAVKHREGTKTQTIRDTVLASPIARPSRVLIRGAPVRSDLSHFSNTQASILYCYLLVLPAGCPHPFTPYYRTISTCLFPNNHPSWSSFIFTPHTSTLICPFGHMSVLTVAVPFSHIFSGGWTGHSMPSLISLARACVPTPRLADLVLHSKPCIPSFLHPPLFRGLAHLPEALKFLIPCSMRIQLTISALLRASSCTFSSLFPFSLSHPRSCAPLHGSRTLPP